MYGSQIRHNGIEPGHQMSILPLQIKRLSRRQFQQFCALIYQECGISLSEEKRELLNARLGKRLRKLNIQPDAYLKLIAEDLEERSRFVDAVSTNHTFFFRESKSFKFIGPRCRRIWCAAASSGEEPYSLAAYCYHAGIDAQVWATDISDTCLQKGRNAVYPIQGSQYIPLEILKKCFQKGRNQWEGHFRVKPEIKRMVQFSRFNLLKDQPPDQQFDIVFCRNVMIYFDKETKESVVRRLIHVLKPLGYFIIGGAESLNGLQHSLRYIEPSVYQKL
jgi:chemotaxis protein methyltransferase CheR